MIVLVVVIVNKNHFIFLLLVLEFYFQIILSFTDFVDLPLADHGVMSQPQLVEHPSSSAHVSQRVGLKHVGPNPATEALQTDGRIHHPLVLPLLLAVPGLQSR